MPTRSALLKDPTLGLHRYLPLIKAAEGKRLNKAKTHHVIYKDNKGYYTIGYGHLLGRTLEKAKKSPYWGKQLTHKEADALALKDIGSKVDKIDRDFGTSWAYWGTPLQDKVVDSYFRGGLPGSPKTKGLMREGSFAKAGTEFLKSQEYLDSVADGSGIAPRMRGLSDALAAEAVRQEEIRANKTRKAAKTKVIPKEVSFRDTVENRLS
jgi:hypothetical protein